jgi:hypothetical protein
MCIILMAINDYFIGGYFVNGCWWLLMIIVLLPIGEYVVTCSVVTYGVVRV